MRFIFVVFIFIIVSNLCHAQVKALHLMDQVPYPVISVKSKDAKGIKWGFEGGRVVKVGNKYHLFTSEMIDNPIWTKMKLGYWVSKDGLKWKRKATVKESTGDFTGTDERAALWSPMPIFDELNKQWNLFYVAYKSAPSDSNNFKGNHAGRIWQAVSKHKGFNGINGPYIDKKVILKPSSTDQDWEGLQGTDSFFPYLVDSTWYALYGSAKTEVKPIKHLLVGMAKSINSSIDGPWVKIPELSPTKIEDYFIENPIVSAAPDGGYICVYDILGDDNIGWAFSEDGIHWPKGNSLTIQNSHKKWAQDIRTPLGLIYEGDNSFTLFYTGFEEYPNWQRLLTGKGKETCAVGKVTLRWQ